MADPNEKIRVTGEEARGGASSHVTRYVLPISLVLVIVIFAYIVIVGV